MKLGKDASSMLLLMIGKGEMDNLLCSDADLLLKVKRFYVFSEVSAVVSLNLFIPDAATYPCCMCKNVKHYRIKEIIHTCNHC